MPPYKIAPIVLPDHAHSIATCQMSAFWPNQHWRLVWPPEMELSTVIFNATARRPHMLTTARDTNREQIVIDTSTGEVVGYARWILPKDYPPAAGSDTSVILWPEAQIPKPSESEAAEFQRLYNSVKWDLRGDMNDTLVDLARGRVLGDRRDWFTLHYLSVHPAHQRKGVATLLVESGLRFADTLALETFLTATPTGLNVYLNHGFVVREKVEQDTRMYGGPEDPETWYFLTREGRRREEEEGGEKGEALEG